MGNNKSYEGPRYQHDTTCIHDQPDASQTPAKTSLFDQIKKLFTNKEYLKTHAESNISESLPMNKLNGDKTSDEVKQPMFLTNRFDSAGALHGPDSAGALHGPDSAGALHGLDKLNSSLKKYGISSLFWEYANNNYFVRLDECVASENKIQNPRELKNRIGTMLKEEFGLYCFDGHLPGQRGYWRYSDYSITKHSDGSYSMVIDASLLECPLQLLTLKARLNKAMLKHNCGNVVWKIVANTLTAEVRQSSNCHAVDQRQELKNNICSMLQREFGYYCAHANMPLQKFLNSQKKDDYQLNKNTDGDYFFSLKPIVPDE
jgi:hypothetical protein